MYWPRYGSLKSPVWDFPVMTSLSVNKQYIYILAETIHRERTLPPVCKLLFPCTFPSPCSDSSKQFTKDPFCMFYFPNSDHVMCSREFAFCLVISYARMCTCIWRHWMKQLSNETSRGLQWENKTCKLKRSIRPSFHTRVLFMAYF